MINKLLNINEYLYEIDISIEYLKKEVRIDMYIPDKSISNTSLWMLLDLQIIVTNVVYEGTTYPVRTYLYALTADCPIRLGGPVTHTYRVPSFVAFEAEGH